MARKGTGFFDSRGNYFKTARGATESDLAAMLGQIGKGDSLAPGVAHLLLERRAQIERLFAEHDAMLAEENAGSQSALDDISDKVTKLPRPTG